MKYFNWSLFILICIFFPSVLIDSAQAFSDGKYTFDDLKYSALLIGYIFFIVTDIKNIIKYGEPR